MADEQPAKGSAELGTTTAAESSSDEHFSDASEGQKASNDRSRGTSPIPITRVERVDDLPSHGEVPGTSAYEKRTQDAVPDEMEIVPDGLRSRSSSSLRPNDRPLTPGGTPVPLTVVERVDDKLAHGEVPGTEAHEIRKADAAPDIILNAPEPRKGDSEESTLNVLKQPPHDSAEVRTSSGGHKTQAVDFDDEFDGDNEEAGDDFGDDFDDFEEGEEGGDDFGDFDDGFQQGDTQEDGFQPATQTPRASAPILPSVPPIIDFTDFSTLEEVTGALTPYIEHLFPDLAKDTPSLTTEETNSIFLSDRSLSLWSQLVDPPPLQPPNWVRSRIRRLFLVSLGVPVDLDEILPASKQKKLILPSIALPSDRSPRLSSDDRAPGAVARLKQGETNASSTSIDSSSSKPGRSGSKRRGPPPAPELDISSTMMLCATTEVKLKGFTDAELRAHVRRLEELVKRAEEVLEYWVRRTESALGDKEAFEGVIENLVRHAKKVRK